jgi:hypothetical protein
VDGLSLISVRKYTSFRLPNKGAIVDTTVATSAGTASRTSADLTAIVGAELPDVTFSWTPEDASLYALAVGACAEDDDRELDLTWACGGPRVVLPTFGVLPGLAHSLRHVSLPGVRLVEGSSLHAGHRFSVVEGAVVPTAGTVVSTGRILEVAETASGALVRRETVSHLGSVDGPVLWRNVVTQYIRGATAATRAPATRTPELPSPALVRALPTYPLQGLLYGLTGDDNPVHGDPMAARVAGFARPILHGLCTLGMAVRALLHDVAEARWDAFREVEVRFLAPLVVGEAATLVAAPEGDGWRFEVWSGRRVLVGVLSLD